MTHDDREQAANSNSEVELVRRFSLIVPMRSHVLNYWDRVRTSYWFVPTIICLFALLLSFLFPMLDAFLESLEVELPNWIKTTASTSRTTLSAISGAMMTVTSTVFSITIVTLSLTSQQFGPRLLRRFMYDFVTQLTLGVFVATGIYCLMILRFVGEPGENAHLPHLSISAAVLMTIFSMAVLIMFIHHIAMLIQAPMVVSMVAHDLESAVDRLFPNQFGHSKPIEELPEMGNFGLEVFPNSDGYLQAIESDSLLNVAKSNDAIIELLARPGNFVSTECPIARVAMDEPSEKDADQLKRTLQNSLIVGVRRTPRQDLLCALEELVEVAVRALSPGFNDSFTAINCLDRIGACLARFSTREIPSRYRYDAEGDLRLIAESVTFAETMDLAFQPIRSSADGNVQVLTRMLEAIQMIARNARRSKDRQIVWQHAQATFSAVKSSEFVESLDHVQILLLDIEKRIGQDELTGFNVVESQSDAATQPT